MQITHTLHSHNHFRKPWKPQMNYMCNYLHMGYPHTLRHYDKNLPGHKNRLKRKLAWSSCISNNFAQKFVTQNRSVSSSRHPSHRILKHTFQHSHKDNMDHFDQSNTAD